MLLFLKDVFIFYFMYMCVLPACIRSLHSCRAGPKGTCVQESENNFQEWVLSFHCVASGYWTQVLSLGSRCVGPLSPVVLVVQTLRVLAGSRLWHFLSFFDSGRWGYSSRRDLLWDALLCAESKAAWGRRSWTPSRPLPSFIRRTTPQNSYRRGT